MKSMAERSGHRAAAAMSPQAKSPEKTRELSEVVMRF